MSIQPLDSPVYQEKYYQSRPIQRAPITTRLTDALPLLSIAARFLICLLCLVVGLIIQAHGQGYAVLAALACGGVIYGLLSPKRDEP